MAGPWEKFKKSEKSGQKPWEKFQKTAENEQKTMVSEPSSDFVGDAEAGLQGFGQGATLGYMPQIQAAIEPAVSKVGDLITGSDTYSDLPDYAARRDQWAKLQQQLAEKHPKSYLGGQLGGGLTTALAVPGAALAKGAGLGLKTAASVGTGAAYRGLMNPGDVEGEVNPLQLKERGMAVADPLALGIDAAIPGAGAAATKIAETKAFKAIGPYARDSMKAFGADKVRDIGRTVLDSEAFGWIPKGYEALAERLSALKNKSGKQLGDTVEQMAQKETGTPIGLSREEIAGNLEKNLLSPDTDLAGVSARNEKMKGYIKGFREGTEAPQYIPQQGTLVPKQYEQNTQMSLGDLGEFYDKNAPRRVQERGWVKGSNDANVVKPEFEKKWYGENLDQHGTQSEMLLETPPPVLKSQDLPLLQAELKKRNLAKEINWDRLPGADIPDNEAFNRELLTQLRSGVEQGGEQLAKKTGYDVNKFKTLKNEYGNLAAAESIADKRAAKEFANRLLSPSDYGTGLIGAGIGFSHGGSPEERMKHAAMGASLGLVNKGARLYGNQITARTMNRVGQGLGYAAQNPLVTQGALSPMSKNTWKTLYDKKENKK